MLAGAFSVFTLVHGCVNPLIGALCARFTPMRVTAVGGLAMGLALFADSFIATPVQLYLGFGVLTALAVAAAGWVPALVHVQRGYQDRLGLSIGIVSSGVGVGMLLVVPLAQLLIDAFGWRAAFRVLGVLCVLWIVPSSLLLLRSGHREPSAGATRLAGARVAPARAGVEARQENREMASTKEVLDRVSSINVDKEKTVPSMRRIADVLAGEKAQPWINRFACTTQSPALRFRSKR